MSVPPEFRKYMELDPKDRERVFQAEVVVSLLQRLGFSVVWDNHGRHEKGNDVVMSNVDRFNHLVYYGAQVKCWDSLEKRDAADLIDDVREAFTCPFDEPKRGEKGYISRFYIINAGTIAPQAIETIRAATATWTRPANILFLDGKALLHLNRWAAFNRGMFIREQLSGLLLELDTNTLVMGRLLIAVGKVREGKPKKTFFAEFHRCRLEAVSRYLSSPPAVPQVLPEKVDEYWQAISFINQLTDFLQNPLLTGIYKHIADPFAGRLANTLALGESLKVAIRQALSELPSVDVWDRQFSSLQGTTNTASPPTPESSNFH